MPFVTKRPLSWEVVLSLSEEEARRFLIRYHLTPRSVGEVFATLGTVQYDPLNPLGRNPDLVLQARVPGYRVDAWQGYAYEQRLAYDTWDKQHSLVPISDWPWRAPGRDRYQPWHDRAILDEYPEVRAHALSEIDARGPLSSLDFADRTRATERHSWYGPTRIKRVLRALWARGELVIHHRQAGRHYYDRAERVIPPRHFHAPPPTLDEYHRWILQRRHQAAGLLRQRADPSVWSGTGDAAVRASALADLVAAGNLIPVDIGAKRTRYHLPSRAVPLLSSEAVAGHLHFLAPLDNLLWDRRALRDLFQFDYVWEVYKPEHLRTWGYYVLPVLYGDRFVARIDARLEGDNWNIRRWWWEEGVRVTPDLLAALHAAVVSFRAYLGARRTIVAPGLDRATRAALRRP